MDKEQKTAQSAQILDAAYACLAREGYAKVSLRQVAKEADVAVSQLSYYYSNKEGLLLAVVARAKQKYLSRIKAHLEQGHTPQEKGRRLIRLFQEILEQDPELVRVLYDLAGLALWSDVVKERVKELFADIIDSVADQVFKGNSSEHGPMRNADPQTLSCLLLGSLFGISIQSVLQPEQRGISESLGLLTVFFDGNQEEQK